MNQAASRVNAPPTVRILAMMEAASVTGPAKNLIGFCRWLRSAEGARSGLSVAIATFDRNARANESDGFAGAARAAGIDTHLIRERYRFDPGVIPQLREIIAKAEPDIIQTHNNKSHLLVKLLPALRIHRLWFAFHHGDAYTDFKQRVYNQVDRVTLRSADRVVSVCEAFAPRLVACGVKPERIRILHNAALPMPPTSDSQRAQLRDQLGIGSGEAVILSIARLSREKGHADLLRALARLRSISREWKLVLLGTGPERDALGQLARALGISERLRFAGFHADVRPFYAIADVFALTSHSEGSSNVLLEAMTAKVPIVATRVGGNPEIVLDEKTGLLVSVADSQTLASAIARLLEEPALVSRLADAAFARATREFSVERYRQRLSGFYAEALDQRKTTPCVDGAQKRVATTRSR
jgi:glycosyltransferase involved in cell wall biosynthesis